MIYHTRTSQVSSGEAIGILLLDSSVPFIPGDVANATTYDFPVRFQKVKGFTVARAVGQDASVYPSLLAAAKQMVEQGVRAVTGDCGFMALHQRRLANELDVPVFLSSLLQIPFILSIIGQNRKVGILTAARQGMDDILLDAVDVKDPSRLVIKGLEESPHFYQFAIAETGSLDSAAVEKEIVDAGGKLVEENPDIGAILLECSLLPPYSQALQKEVQLPVFDYVTMINFVFSTVVARRYQGFM